MTDQTITAEQIEKAAGGMWDLYGKPGMFPYAPDHLRTAFLTDARAAFRAAGLRIEGDET